MMYMMKQMICKLLILTISFTLAVSSFSMQVFSAEETHQKVKIGLFYAGTAKDYYTIASDDGISLSLADDTSSSLLAEDNSVKSVTIKKNTYFSTELADTFNTIDEAFLKTAELRAGGFDAYTSICDGNITVRLSTFSSLEEADEFAKANGAYAVGFGEKSVLVLNGNSIWLALDDPSLLCEVSSPSGMLSINGKKYRGAMRFLRASGNDMAAINVLPMDEYLYSVVAKEVTPSWNEEVLKAQAVAARTFTITNINKFAKYGFNLDDTTTSQVYGGVAAEHPRTTAAVDATSGQIVLYDGKPAQTYYFASSGGKTANCEDVWSAKLPYLVSVDDIYENPLEATKGRWEYTFTAAQIKEKLAASGVDIGNIEDVKIEYTDYGRAKKMTFVGTKGTKEYLKDNIRVPLGLPSTNFKLNPSEENIAASDSANIELLSGFVTKDGFSISSSSAASISKLLLYIKSEYEPKEDIKAFEKPKDVYTFVGGGWGHGIGMSQWGAKAMADNGFGYKEILQHYFSGVQVDIY